MPIQKAKLVQAKSKSAVVAHWQRRSAGEGRFAVVTLFVAALAVVTIWGLWRYASAAAESAAANGPPVRVGVVADSTHVRVLAYSGFDIVSSAGRSVFTCAGQNVLRFSAAGGQPGAFFYYVVVSEFEKRKKPEARRLLTQLRDVLKVGMEILEVSDRLILPRDRAGLGDRLLVAVGPFDDLKLADQWNQYLSQTYRSYLVKDTSKRASGEILLYDHKDGLLARMKDSLTIRLKDEKQLISAEALQSAAAGWSSAKRTSPRYRGTIEIRLNDQARLTAINTLLLEEYVKGIVPSEIGGESPYESLKAQAIAARSEAYHKLGLEHHINDLYDFCGKVHCQNYLGVEEQTPASVRAVDETRGQVLVYQNQVIDAVYCHSCGGVSADSADVWRSLNFPFFQAVYDRRFWRSLANLSSEQSADAWLSSRPDVFCNSDQRGFPDYAKKYFRWTRRMSGAALQRAVNETQNVGQVLDLQVIERTESGRVRVLRVVGSKTSIPFTGSEKICALFNDLPSSFFILRVDHDTAEPHAVKSATIQGGGFGHGVGMCQMGAYMMAKRGYLSLDILSHYYPKTTIRKIY
jgi:SpoIID/LytB domain protein